MNKEYSFALSDLLQQEKLMLAQEDKSIEKVFDSLLPKDTEGKLVRPLIVGIDGAVTAGKSFTASRLDAYLKGRGYDSTLIHGDWYMASREKRQREMERAKSDAYSIVSYDRMNCDFDDIANTVSLIRYFYQDGNELLKTRVSSIYNRKSGKRDGHVDLEVKKLSVVIVEGTGVLNKQLSTLIDLKIRVDLEGYQETVERLYQREAEKPESNRLTKVFVRERYDLIDHRYDQYLRRRDSKYFDVLLDTTVTDSIKVYVR